jgi:acyl-CoA thioesterase-1
MIDNRRQILEKLNIRNYKSSYQLKVKNKAIRRIVKLTKMGVFFLFVICISFSACKDEKSRPNESQTNVKEEIKSEDKKKTDNKVILFYGNSLTAGYGLNENESFPSLIEDRIDSLGLKYTVVNAGLSGETTSGGLKRIDWVMKQKVDIFFLELGANDMLRGLPLNETRKNLSEIISIVKAKNPNVKIGLCEMMAPPNMGEEYVKEFTKIYKDLSSPSGITLIPFFLEGVAGDEDLLLKDGKHPNAEGQVIVAENIWRYLEKML